jgi:hypothetical protein
MRPVASNATQIFEPRICRQRRYVYIYICATWQLTRSPYPPPRSFPFPSPLHLSFPFNPFAPSASISSKHRITSSTSRLAPASFVFQEERLPSETFLRADATSDTALRLSVLGREFEPTAEPSSNIRFLEEVSSPRSGSSNMTFRRLDLGNEGGVTERPGDYQVALSSGQEQTSHAPYLAAATTPPSSPTSTDAECSFSPSFWLPSSASRVSVVA